MLSHFIKVNINDQVKVKLTEDGLKMIQEHVDRIFGGPINHSESLRKASMEQYLSKVDPDGYFTTQLHDLFFIFGKSLYMGAKRFPFERGSLYFSNESTSVPDNNLPYVIVSPDGVYWLGHAKDEKDAWKIALGWPTEDEINHKKSLGWYATDATVEWSAKLRISKHDKE